MVQVARLASECVAAAEARAGNLAAAVLQHVLVAWGCWWIRVRCLGFRVQGLGFGV